MLIDRTVQILHRVENLVECHESLSMLAYPPNY
jgi:hypothetical protein